MILVVLMIFILTGTSKGQKFELGFSTGYSTFGMKSMSENLELYRASLPVDAQTMADYPSWISFGGYLTNLFPFGYSIGLEYTFNSTGGRISSADYSGSYSFNQTLTGNSIGVLNGYRFLKLGKFGAEARLSIGALISGIRNEERFDFVNYEETTTEKSTAVSFYATPSLQLSGCFSFIKAGAFFGYLFDSGGSFEFPNTPGKEQTLDWSGIRAGISIAVLPDLLPGFKKL